MTPTREPDYRRLHAFRTTLRAFLRWSENSAREVGLTPAQHQLLLAVMGSEVQPPTIADLAQDLMLRHHSAGELINRAEAAGLVQRVADDADRRHTRIKVTANGQRVLRKLAEQHLMEIRRLAPIIDMLAADEPH